MNNIVKLIVSVTMVGLMICCGCSKSVAKKKERQNESNQNSLLAPYKDTDVLLRIGTNEFTKAEFMRMCSLRKRFLELVNQSALQELTNGIDPSVVELQMLTAYPGKVMAETIMREYAATSGISLAKGDINRARQSFQQGCGKGFVSWKKFMSDFKGEIGRELEAEIERIALTEAVRRGFFERNKITVSKSEVADCKKWTADYNARATQTNALIWANASNIWKRITKKEITFEEAANKYTQDEYESENGEWAAFTLDSFDDEPELKRRIEGLAPGNITPPIEGDNGLMILRLDAIQKGEKEGDKDRYVLKRVFFRLPEFYEIAKDDELEQDMLRTKQNKTFERFVEDMAKSKKLEYVVGKEIFDKAREMVKMPINSVM